jgi:hypothetical protein
VIYNREHQQLLHRDILSNNRKSENKLTVLEIHIFSQQYLSTCNSAIDILWIKSMHIEPPNYDDLIPTKIDFTWKYD